MTNRADTNILMIYIQRGLLMVEFRVSSRQVRVLRKVRRFL